MLQARLFTVGSLSLITLLLMVHASAAVAVTCPNLEPYESDLSSTQALSDSLADNSLVSIAIPGPGWLAVQVENADSPAQGVWWELWPTSCAPAASVIEGGSGRGLIEVRAPGLLHLRLATIEGRNLDQEQSIKFTTLYLPLSKDLEKDDDDNETEESEILPSKEDDDNETEESEILPNNGCSICGCAPEPANNLMLCATPVRLGDPLFSSLESPGLDDRDYYVFRLDHSRVVTLSTSGETDTLGALYDEKGRLLAHDDDGGERTNFSLEVHLKAGTYFIRVEGTAGSEGEYRLQITD